MSADMQIEYFQVTAESDERLPHEWFVVATGLRVRIKYGRNIGSSLVY